MMNRNEEGEEFGRRLIRWLKRMGRAFVGPHVRSGYPEETYLRRNVINPIRRSSGKERPEDWTEAIDPTRRNLVVLDDLMQECGNDPGITKLFTQGSHHRNLSVIYIVQNLFHRSKET